MNNYLLDNLQNYFNETLLIEGMLITSNAFIKSSLSESMSVHAVNGYRDLSILEGDNLFTPNFSFTLFSKDNNNGIDHLLSQQCGHAVSQSYEVFESYLIDIVSNFFYNNQLRMVDLKISNEADVFSLPTIRKLIKGQYRDNKSVLALVKKISPYYKNIESNNCYSVKMNEWFDMISLIRHIVVHSRGVISDKSKEEIKTKNQQLIFERFFSTKIVNGREYVYFEKDKASDATSWLHSLAHSIFKALSLEANLPVEIPQFSHFNAKEVNGIG